MGRVCFAGSSFVSILIPNINCTMRAPSLLAQCLPGLAPQDKGSQSMSSISERDAHFPSPAVEIIPSKACLFS